MLDKLKDLHKNARIARNEVESNLWGYLIGECTRLVKNPTTEEVLHVLKKYVNSISSFDNETNKQEIELIKPLLPQMLSEDEIKQIIIDNIELDFGALMKHFKANYNGKFDGKLIKQIWEKI